MFRKSRVSLSIAGLLAVVLVTGLGTGSTDTVGEPLDVSTALTVDPIQRVGAWPFGPSYAVDVDIDRDLVFLGSGGVVLVLDGADPTEPVLITDRIRTVGLVEDIAYDVVNQRLFLACGEGGLEIWDLTTPETPALLSITEVLYFGYDTPVGHVELWDHFAIVEAEWGYVHSLDVSDPLNPVEVNFHGGMGNPARDIHVSVDGQVHSTGAQNYQRLNIESSGFIRDSGSKEFTYGPYAVFGTPEVAYVGYAGYVHILDLLISFFPTWTTFDAGGVTGLEVHNGIAYIINGIGLRLFDVSVHNSPFHLGTLPSDMHFYDFVVSDDLAYIAAGVDGLRVVDVSDTANPTEIGAFEEVLTITWKSVVVGDYAFLAHDRDGVLVIDISDQQSPELAGRFETPDAVRDVAIQGDLLYTAASDGGLRIADISDPTTPVEVGALEDVDAWRVEPAGEIVYVIEAIANQPDWLYAIDVGNPELPVELGSMQLPDLTWDLAWVGDVLYVAAHDDGIRIVDVSNPGAPVEVGSYPLPDVTELVVRDNQLFVAAHNSSQGGFFILDITDPLAPAPIGSYMDAGFAVFHLDVQGDYAAVNDGSDLHLMFIGDPTTPVNRDEYRMPGGLVGITMRDRYIYVSDADAGLQIVENLLYEDPGGGLQWQELDSGTGADLHGVCFGDATTGWAIGDAGTILATSDGGDSWLPQTSGTSATLLDISCTDSQQAWVVGSGGSIRATSDGGATWIPQISGTGAELSSVDFADATTGWAVGSGGTVIHTSNGGASWEAQPSGTTSFLNGVSFVDPLHGWIAAGDFGTVLRTTDGGANWQSIATGSTAILLDIDFADTANGWAVGIFGEVVTTDDGGSSWVSQPTPHPPDWLYATHFIDAEHGWAVGFDGKVMSTDQGGWNWTAQASGVHVQLEGVHFVDTDLGFAVGTQGTILRSSASVETMFTDDFESGDTSRWSGAVT